jgi:hypothetical protein
VQFTIGVKRGFEEVRVSIFKKASNSFGYWLPAPHLIDISNEFESSILADKRFNQIQQQRIGTAYSPVCNFYQKETTILSK